MVCIIFVRIRLITSTVPNGFREDLGGWTETITWKPACIERQSQLISIQEITIALNPLNSPVWPDRVCASLEVMVFGVLRHSFTNKRFESLYVWCQFQRNSYFYMGNDMSQGLSS